MIHLASMDLNLLVALDALLTERNVTRAGKRIGLSQSAMSNALARLRNVLDDPILIRASCGMVPTARAEALEVPLRTALEQIGFALNKQPEFDPAHARNRFRINAADFLQIEMLPALMDQLSKSAPEICVDVEELTSVKESYRLLETGELDLAISRFANPPDMIHFEKLFSSEIVAIARKNHPRIKKTSTLKTFLEESHLRTAQFGNEDLPQYQENHSQGHSTKQRIQLKVPQFMVAPFVVSRTDIWAYVLARAITPYEKELGLVRYKPPIEIPDIEIHMAWHHRRHNDPAHRWFRETLRSLYDEERDLEQ